jgi:hypothetical protein
MAKKMTPPTILKLLMEIPKNLNKTCPEKAKAIMVINATILAFLAVLLRFSLLNVFVIDIKIGIVPKGFINVKNEVKIKIANVK